MKKIATLAGIGLLPFLAMQAAPPAQAANNTAAIIGGLVAGAVIGAAVASDSKHSKNIYVDKKPNNKWSNSFSPKPGVTCYPAQHACYKRDGSYAANMTEKVFY